MELIQTQKSVIIIHWDYQLSSSLSYTHRNLSLTYTQKCASLRDTPHRLFSSFLPRIHGTLYVRQITTRTRCSARCLTFCNKLYGKRTTTTRLDKLHGYVIPESTCSTLTSKGRQIDYIPTEHRREAKGKGRKPTPVLSLPASLI